MQSSNNDRLCPEAKATEKECACVVAQAGLDCNFARLPRVTVDCNQPSLGGLLM